METWLNGWARIGDAVLIGTGVYCLGCGEHLGTTTVVFEEGYTLPDKEPDYPFSKGACPICDNRYKEHTNLLPDDLAKHYSLGELRQALAIKKSAQQGVQPTVLYERRKLVTCPQCKTIFGVELPAPHIG